MTLTLYSHPLASFCWKVLVALYENGTPFEARLVDLADEGEKRRFLDFWPIGKMPLLYDQNRDRVVPESTIIIDYLDRHHPGAAPLIPVDPELGSDVRLWDRFFDGYVQAPMQKIVADRLRPEGQVDPYGVAEARATLQTAYSMIETRMRDRQWGAGDRFSLIDCAAMPALFYAGTVEPFADDNPHLAAYLERLMARPSCRRVLDEARPFFRYFPYRDRLPDQFQPSPE